ncbi:helix-turn-helix domain-containing protein [Chryseobacterium lactis]|nr:helix-turn-helix domain-containing protein [Chryseobacterium lactis]
MSYSELELTIQNLENKPDEQWKYINNFIRKAKKETNPEKTRRGYVLASFNKRGKEQILYGDSILIIAKKINDNNIIGDSYLSLGMSYTNNENYPKALDAFIKGYDYIKKNKNPYLIHNAEYQIAQTKSYLGLYQDAHELLTDCVSFFRLHHEKIEDTHYAYYYLYSLIALIETNSHLSNFNANTSLIQEGIDFIKKNPDFKEYYAYFISSQGTDLYYQHKYDQAVVKIHKAIQLYNDSWKHLTDKFYLGMSLWKLGKKEEALPYFLLFDQEYKETGKLDPKFRPAFEILIRHYSENNDSEKQLEYINTLLILDKAYEKDYKYLNSTLNKEYDTKKLHEEKEILENKIKWERFFYFTLIGFGFLVILFLTFLLTKYYNRRKYSKILNERYFEIQDEDIPVQNEMFEQTNDDAIIDDQLGINPLIVENVLKTLSSFEKDKQYLKKNISLASMSKLCGTNTVYLSRIINFYKKKSFNEYLNELRLDHIVSQWKNKPKTRYISIQKTAENAGYNTTQTFTKNFQEKYNIPPTYFLNQLNKES